MQTSTLLSLFKIIIVHFYCWCKEDIQAKQQQQQQNISITNNCEQIGFIYVQKSCVVNIPHSLTAPYFQSHLFFSKENFWDLKGTNIQQEKKTYHTICVKAEKGAMRAAREKISNVGRFTAALIIVYKRFDFS